MVTQCDDTSKFPVDANQGTETVDSVDTPSGYDATMIRSNQTSSTNLDSIDISSENSNFASKCLHVGNVPANLSEKDLIKEFEKFGSVEGVKLINQRGRRFAFVCCSASFFIS